MVPAYTGGNFVTDSKPMISVIIPAYNAEHTIERACRSVLTQSYPNVELVVVNDGSKDTTAQILTQLQREYPNLRIISQENGGVSRARNTGLDNVHGAYIMFLDADDELESGIMERLVAISDDHDCDIVAGGCLRIRPDGTSFYQGIPVEGEMSIWQGEEALLCSLKDHPSTYAVWGKLYRREAIGDTRFVEGRKLHEDSFFMFEILRRGIKIAATNLTVVRYYLTANSASRAAFSEKFLDMLYFADRKFAIVESEYPHLIPLGKNVLVKANMALLKTMWSAKESQYKAMEKQCLRTVRENAAYFIPAIRVDKILFLFIRLRLFWLYKLIYRLLRR